MTKSILLISLSSLASLTNLSAVTTFTGTVDNLWGNAGNWDTGLPGDPEVDGVIPNGQNVVVDATDNGTRGFNLLVDSGGSLTINSGVILSANSGAQDTTVSGTMDVSGRFIQLGNLSDVFIAGGTMNILSGGQLDARKGFEIYNGGALNLAADTVGIWALQDRLRVGNGGSLATLHFDVLSGVNTTIAGNTLEMQIGSQGILDLNLLGTGVGSYDLITGISQYQDAGGTFGNRREFNENFTNLGAGLAADVVYSNFDTASNANLGSISLVITAIPEPSTGLLALLGAAALIRRRR